MPRHTRIAPPRSVTRKISQPAAVKGTPKKRAISFAISQITENRPLTAPRAVAIFKGAVVKAIMPPKA